MMNLNTWIRRDRQACLLALAALLAWAAPAEADPDLTIPEGFDAWMTIDSEVGLGTTIESPPALPPGFFGPGSDPFIGGIDLRGEPLGPGAETDTIIQRLGPAVLDGPPVASDTVDIQLVALSLVSTQPITVNVSGEPSQLWDVRVDLSMVQPLGQMTINKEHDPGNGIGGESGTFNSILPVQPRLTFIRADQIDPVMPQIILSPINLMQTSDPNGQFWFTDVPPGFSPDPLALGNQFFPEPFNPYILEGGGFSITLVPSEMPEPATGMITAFALLGLTARRQRKSA